MQLFCKLHFDWVIHLCLSINEMECFYCDIIIITLQNEVSQ